MDIKIYEKKIRWFAKRYRMSRFVVTSAIDGMITMINQCGEQAAGRYAKEMMVAQRAKTKINAADSKKYGLTKNEIYRHQAMLHTFTVKYIEKYYVG